MDKSLKWLISPVFQEHRTYRLFENVFESETSIIEASEFNKELQLLALGVGVESNDFTSKRRILFFLINPNTREIKGTCILCCILLVEIILESISKSIAVGKGRSGTTINSIQFYRKKDKSYLLVSGGDIYLDNFDISSLDNSHFLGKTFYSFCLEK